MSIRPSVLSTCRPSPTTAPSIIQSNPVQSNRVPHVGGHSPNLPPLTPSHKHSDRQTRPSHCSLTHSPARSQPHCSSIRGPGNSCAPLLFDPRAARPGQSRIYLPTSSVDAHAHCSSSSSRPRALTIDLKHRRCHSKSHSLPTYVCIAPSPVRARPGQVPRRYTCLHSPAAAIPKSHPPYKQAV